MSSSWKQGLLRLETKMVVRGERVGCSISSAFLIRSEQENPPLLEFDAHALVAWVTERMEVVRQGGQVLEEIVQRSCLISARFEIDVLTAQRNYEVFDSDVSFRRWLLAGFGFFVLLLRL